MLAGAGRKTRVHQVRGCSPLFLCNEAEIVSELSIFIDESGDFGTYDIRSPYYIITMVFHDQSCRSDQNPCLGFQCITSED